MKEKYPELKSVHSQVLQDVVYRLFWNLKVLSQLKKSGRKVGRLRFKGRGWFKTFTYPQSGFKIVETDKRLDILQLSKIGDIPIRMYRKIEGKIKTLTIKRHTSGKWFACMCVDKGINIIQKEPKRVVGIDVGIKYFLTDSDGRRIENPRFFQRTFQRIKVLQHWLSRRKKGSKRRERQRIKLAKVYEKLVNQRDDFLHKLSRFYVKSYDVICVEELNIEGMVRNHHLAGKILDASWGKFLQMLSYKAERAGRMVVEVNPRGTSEGLAYDDPLRDWISAMRIKMRGWDNPDSPVEMEPLQELAEVPASSIIEAGSPMRSVG